MVNADLLFRVRPSALSALALLHYASPLTSFPSYALLASVHPFIHSDLRLIDRCDYSRLPPLESGSSEGRPARQGLAGGLDGEQVDQESDHRLGRRPARQ